MLGNLARRSVEGFARQRVGVFCGTEPRIPRSDCKRLYLLVSTDITATIPRKWNAYDELL